MMEDLKQRTVEGDSEEGSNYASDTGGDSANNVGGQLKVKQMQVLDLQRNIMQVLVQCDSANSVTIYGQFVLSFCLV